MADFDCMSIDYMDCEYCEYFLRFDVCDYAYYLIDGYWQDEVCSYQPKEDLCFIRQTDT